MLNLRQTKYLGSAWKKQDFPPDRGAEIAFVGRSNAGKSTLINKLTGQSQLARVSKTPGRTQAIHFFQLAQQNGRLVDLPGYGYAKAAMIKQQNWLALMKEYLENRVSLRGIFLLMDIRHPLKEIDLLWIEWIKKTPIKLHIILTKADKLSASLVRETEKKVQSYLPESTVQIFSATKQRGLESLQIQLAAWLGIFLCEGES